MAWIARAWRQRRRGRVGAAAVLTLVIGCSAEPTAVEQLPDEMRTRVESLGSAAVPERYAFTYTPLGPLTVGCLVGVETVDGAVDAGRRLAVFTPRDRAGSVLSLDDGLLISTALLVGRHRNQSWARLELGSEPEPSHVARLADALGATLSGLVAAGAWPTDPNELARAAIAEAAQLTPVAGESGRSALRVVLDRASYEADLRDGGATLELERFAVPPILDVSIRDDGLVDRFVVHRARDDDPTQIDPEGGGYAMSFDFASRPAISVPGSQDVVKVTAGELPTEPAPPPCKLQM